MKKLFYKLFLLIVLISGSAKINAQVELTAYGGYALDDKFDFYYGNGKIHGAGLFGASVGLRTSQGTMLEFMWQHTSTSIEVYDYYESLVGSYYDIDVNVDYFTLNFGYSRAVPGSPVQPFAGVMLGGVNVGAKDYGESTFMFNPGLQAGVKVFPNEKFGIRLQAALMMPTQGMSGGFGCSIGTGGSGCGTGVSTYTSITQMTFSGGVILNLGE